MSVFDGNSARPPASSRQGPPHHLPAALVSAGHPGALSPANAMPDTATLLTAIKRRALLVASVGFVAAMAAGLAAWFLLSPRYTVMAQLLVSAEKPKILPRGLPERDTSPGALRTQVAAVKRVDVLNKALQDVVNLSVIREQPDPILW